MDGGIQRQNSTAAVPALIKGLLAVELLMGACYVAAWTVADSLGEFYKLIDMEREKNVPAWFSSVQLAAVGVLLGIFAVVKFRRTQVRTWALLLAPLLFFAMSCDEYISLHERLGQMLDGVFGDRSGTALDRTGLWIVFGAPALALIVAVLGWTAWPVLRPLPKVVAMLVAGMLLYLVFVAGVEGLSNLVEPGTGPDVALTAIEETGEMVAITVVLWAVLLLLRGHGIRLVTAGSPPEAARADAADPAAIAPPVSKPAPAL